MSRLPVLSGKVLLKILQKHGYRLLRQKGSHVFVETKDGSCGTVIPIHKNEALGKGILISILNDLNLERDTLLIMLKK